MGEWLISLISRGWWCTGGGGTTAAGAALWSEVAEFGNVGGAVDIGFALVGTGCRLIRTRRPFLMPKPDSGKPLLLLILGERLHAMGHARALVAAVADVGHAGQGRPRLDVILGRRRPRQNHPHRAVPFPDSSIGS